MQYTIPQGRHTANPRPIHFFRGSVLQFIVHFDSSAIYKNTAKGTGRDVNKLYGFSDNFALHHRYSARFGWRWLNDSLHLLAYYYNNGYRSFQEITSIRINAFDTCRIRVTKGAYIFSVNQKSITVPREASGRKACGYLLYPYFGGDATAPHTISIYIRRWKEIE